MQARSPDRNEAAAEAPWLVSVSYQREPHEEFEVQNNAQKRFSGPLGDTFIYQTVLFAFIVLGLIVGAVELSRRFTPIFREDTEALTYHSQYWAAFLPMVIVFIVATFGYMRMLRHKRNALRLGRIRARGWADFEITAHGFIYLTTSGNQRFEWRTVRNISHSKDKIYIDLDQTVFYIPERAFKDRADFLAQYKVIRQAWHDRLMQEVSEKS